MPAAEFRARLKELGWSQARLADKLEKAPHTIGKWANGELHVPGYMRFVFELLYGISAAEKKLRELHEND